jgi:hypothetical protein
MNIKNNNLKNSNIVLTYTISGFIFGFLFPFFTWTFFLTTNKYFFNIDDIKLMHINNPVLFIIDLAPFVLGFVSFFLAGKISRDRLQLIEQLKKNKTIITQYTNFAQKIAEGKFTKNEKIQDSNLERTLL